MKKLFALLTLMCLLPLCALAEMDEDGDVVVTLPGMEFFFTPIEGGYLLTREDSASAFNQLGLRQYEVLQHMESYDIYAMLFFGDEAQGTVEVQVCAYETVETDFDEMNEYGERLMCEALLNSFTDQGYRVSKTEAYHAPEGHIFIRVDMAWDGAAGEEYATVYITCQAGYTVALRFYPYDGPMTEAQMEASEFLADSLWIRATE